MDTYANMEVLLQAEKNTNACKNCVFLKLNVPEALDLSEHSNSHFLIFMCPIKTKFEFIPIYVDTNITIFIVSTF